MDPEVARLSRETDDVMIGRRIRQARLAAGLTQRELAEGVASAAYLSRIEAGNRRASRPLLGHVSARMGVSIESLLAGAEPVQGSKIEQSLTYAELALKNGDAPAALASLESLRDVEDLDATTAVALRARFLRASALEAQGDNRAAIKEFERLAVEAPRDRHWIGMVMALSRCHRIIGDFDRAIEVGIAAAPDIDACGLADTEEAIRLTVTVAGSYFERGDLHQALRMCERAAGQAEEIGSDLALGSAYWNASVVRASQGDLRGALALGERALAAFTTSADARSLALIQGFVVDLQLSQNPPDLDAAESNLLQARETIEWSDASRISRERQRLLSARLLLGRGRLEEARWEAEECYAIVQDLAPTFAAEVCIVLGRIALQDGHKEVALQHFRNGVLKLSACGADRLVAECWAELGALLQAGGDEAAALDAFRRAAASTGLRINDPSLTRL